MEKEKETITAGAVALFSILVAIATLAVADHLLTQDTYTLHWKCNGIEFKGELLSKDTELFCE